MNKLAALFCGALFGAGLVISGMTNPEKVLAFLTLNHEWDPSLIGVLGSALVVTTLGYHWVQRRTAPLFDAVFHIPSNTQFDARLLLGATAFGAGWGIAGFCPGPAIVAAMLLDPRALIFLSAFISGLYAYEWMTRSQARAQAQRSDG